MDKACEIAAWVLYFPGLNTIECCFWLDEIVKHKESFQGSLLRCKQHRNGSGCCECIIIAV